MLAVTRHWPAVPSNGSVAAVLELVAEGDASVLDAIATGATSDQARATAWPGVVRRLAAVSRSGGPPLGLDHASAPNRVPSDRLRFDPEFGQPRS
jgi:hypothetical protein